jgi:hypothetical protein
MESSTYLVLMELMGLAAVVEGAAALLQFSLIR